MNILDQIISQKKKEVEERKSLYPVKLLERSTYFGSPTVSFKKYLQRKAHGRSKDSSFYSE